MDFDEYEYLEKTVESAELVKGSNGTNVKSRSAEKRRTGEGDDDDGYNSKRHRSTDGDRGDRGKSDDRDRSNTERSKDRGERDKDRDRDRDRNRERERSDREKSDRSHRDRDRDRDAERERDKEHRDKDREKERDRDRERDNRDGERRRHSKDRDRDRDRDYDRERERERRSKDRSHSRSRDIDREASRSRDIERDHRFPREKREKKEEAAAEPEADPERDQRTVFAFQISLKASEKDVYEFFSRAGKVRDVKLIMDRNTRRSKGVGYIEFYDAMAVPMAIALTGQLLLGQPVMVKPSEAEKNLVQSTSTATTGAGGMMGPYSGSARRLYVGNLHTNITEAQLKQVFEPFGTIELVQLPLEPETGRCKGYGFVQYSRLEDARTAQQELNGVLELAGRVIKVTPMTEQMSIQDATVAPGELDDDDGGGVSLTARSRALLMQKLDRSGTVSSIVSSAAPSLLPGAGVAVPPALPGLGIPGMVGLPNPAMGAAASLGGGIEPIGAPTECLLLKNMFDPSTETEPDFDLDIKDEVQSECSKYGAVKHIFVDKNSAGHVYLRFNNLASAANAQRALHGRWFAGKMITTTFMTPQAYEAKFPQSR